MWVVDKVIFSEVVLFYHTNEEIRIVAKSFYSVLDVRHYAATSTYKTRVLDWPTG